MTSAFNNFEEEAYRATGNSNLYGINRWKLPESSRKDIDAYMSSHIEGAISRNPAVGDDPRAKRYRGSQTARDAAALQEEQDKSRVGAWDDFGASGAGPRWNEASPDEEEEVLQGRREDGEDQQSEDEPEEDDSTEETPETNPEEEQEAEPEETPLGEPSVPEGVDGVNNLEKQEAGAAKEVGGTEAKTAAGAGDAAAAGGGAVAAAAPEAGAIMTAEAGAAAPELLLFIIVIFLILFGLWAWFYKYPQEAVGSEIPKNTKICLDPGHPSSTSGANGEKEINFLVATDLKKALEDAGFTVVMTKNSADQEVGNYQRATICADAGAGYMYALHADGTERSAGYPFHVYPKSSRSNISTESKGYAEIIQNEVSKAMSGVDGFKDGGVCAEGSCTAVENLGIYDGADDKKMPAGLIEMVQLSDGHSALDDSDTRSKFVIGLVSGFIKAFPAASGADPGDSTKPKNTISKGSGWSLKDNVDYSGISCAAGSKDKGTYTHPTKGFTIRKCGTGAGVVASLISKRTLNMIAAAKADGVTLSGSGFRSYEEQQGLYNSNCSSSGCSPPTARPGNSQHERGLAIDFDDAGKTGEVFKWLSKNGSNYGYINLPSESWHWSMSGN